MTSAAEGEWEHRRFPEPLSLLIETDGDRLMVSMGYGGD